MRNLAVSHRRLPGNTCHESWRRFELGVEYNWEIDKTKFSDWLTDDHRDQICCQCRAPTTFSGELETRMTKLYKKKQSQVAKLVESSQEKQETTQKCAPKTIVAVVSICVCIYVYVSVSVYVCVRVCFSPTYISCIPIDKICIWLFGDIAFLWFICGTPKNWIANWAGYIPDIEHCSGGCLGLYVTHIFRLIAALDRSILCAMWHVWQRELIQFAIWPSRLANHRHPLGGVGVSGGLWTVSKLVWLCHKNTCGLLISYFCGSSCPAQAAAVAGAICGVCLRSGTGDWHCNCNCYW